MSYYFDVEPLDDLMIHDLEPLLEAHWKEIAHYQDIPLGVDWEGYRKAFHADQLRVFTVREYSKLVGYAIFLVRRNPHYSSSLQATQDVLYLDPQVRHAGIGGRFIDWCDQQLRDEGVQAVYHHVKSSHNFGPLLERYGYQLVDLVYARRLDQ